jgi:hypothetical protein
MVASRRVTHRPTPIFKAHRFREQFWRRGSMQSRKFHFAPRAWEWNRFWFKEVRGMYL